MRTLTHLALLGWGIVHVSSPLLLNLTKRAGETDVILGVPSPGSKAHPEPTRVPAFTHLTLGSPVKIVLSQCGAYTGTISTWELNGHASSMPPRPGGGDVRVGVVRPHWGP